MDIDFKHQTDYRTKITFFKIMLISFLVAGLAAILLLLYAPPDSLLFVICLVSTMITVILCIIFFIFFLMARGRAKKSGSYEFIDIIDNQIIYKAEKTGEKVFTPENIASMKIYKNTHHADDVHYNINIQLKDSNSVFVVSRWVSNYRELVRKMRHFKNCNNIPG